VIGDVFAKKSARTPRIVLDNCRSRFLAYDALARE
jgi:hypothetical protein